MAGRCRRCACRADNNSSSLANDSLDWGQSIPSYLQSTVATELCDDWSDAILQAEAMAAARQRAVNEGRDPEQAASETRETLGTASRPERLWQQIRSEASREIDGEPILSSFLFTSVLSHSTFADALAFVLSNRIADNTLLPTQLFSLFVSLMRRHPEVLQGAVVDLEAVHDRDPACLSYLQALLYFKGYHALQLQRFAHALWQSGRRVMALSLQSRLSEVLAVDIHPAAKFGRGILLDHGTGVVIGETAVIGNGASIMQVRAAAAPAPRRSGQRKRHPRAALVQNVTLGGTGKDVGDRHPKIGSNVLIGAGASILGNITVGTGAQIAAGSLVLKPVEPHTMVAGSPAKCVGDVHGNPAQSLNQWDKSLEYDVAKEDILVTAPRAAQTVPTQGGGEVRVYQEADYYRHIAAEKQLLSGAGALRVAGKEEGGPAHEAPGDTGSNGTGGGMDADARAAASRALIGTSVAATTSDVEAARQWGDNHDEPEFFI